MYVYLFQPPHAPFFFFLAIYLHGRIRNLVCEVSKWLDQGKGRGGGGGGVTTVTAGKSFAFRGLTVDHADFWPTNQLRMCNNGDNVQAGGSQKCVRAEDEKLIYNK